MGRVDKEMAAPGVVVILAAGAGSRLHQKTKTPKPLAKVLGLSLAERVVCAFLKDLKVREFIVVVGHEAEAVQAHFRDIGRRRGATISFVEAEDWRLGNGASALSVKGRTGKTPFYLSMTDHLFEPEIARSLARRAPKDGQVCLAVDRGKSGVFDLEDVTRVKTRGEHIRDIAKDLKDWDAADTGLFLCTDGLFDGLERAAARGRHGLSDGLRELAHEKRAIAVDVSGRSWLDVDTPEALSEAERRLARAEAGKASDGPVSRYLNRPLSRFLTRYLVRTAVTPNQISLLSWGLSCLAALLFAAGGYPALAGGGVIAQLASVIDGCDGEIARMKRMESEFGAWFDAVLDRYADAFLLFGLMWHAYAASAAPETLLVGFAAIVGSFLSSYTADKYDGLMARRIGRASRLRMGRDVRVFMIFAGAVLNLAFPTLVVIAVVMNVEVVRRVILCGKSHRA